MRLAVMLYAVLVFCLLGTLLGYTTFHHFVGVDTDCAGSPAVCGDTTVAIEWTVTGSLIGAAVGVGPKTLARIRSAVH